MLKENPKSRPNIYQVLREACLMQGIEVPIKDVCLDLDDYANEAHYYRYMREGRNQKLDETNNYRPHQTIHRHLQ
jgi:hypothetical protein